MDDSDDPLTGWLTNDLPVDIEVYYQNPGCGTQIPELPADQSRVQARDECTVCQDSTVPPVVGSQGTATDEAIHIRRVLLTRRPATQLDL